MLTKRHKTETNIWDGGDVEESVSELIGQTSTLTSTYSYEYPCMHLLSVSSQDLCTWY